jgi:hypothetical protein
MGLLDDLLWNVGPDLPALSGRRARRVLREGEACDAQVVGIEVERDTSDTVEPEYRYALDVRAPTGVLRVGVRQRLTPRYDAHLGAVVPVRVRGARVVIDWDQHLGQRREGDEPLVGTWRMVDPPAEGVTDRSRRRDRRRLETATAARVTVLGVTQTVSVLGPTENLDVDVRLEADGIDEQRRLDKVLPPDYARALLAAGAVLPAGLDKGGRRLTIDWEAAANAARPGRPRGTPGP